LKSSKNQSVLISNFRGDRALIFSNTAIDSGVRGQESEVQTHYLLLVTHYSVKKKQSPDTPGKKRITKKRKESKS